MKSRFHRIARVLLTVLVIAAPATALLAHTEITPGEVREMIDSGEDLIVLDVREYSEFCGSFGHIEDAVNLPWSTNVLQARFSEVPSDATIIVTCASGGRSHLASDFLDGRGYSHVYDMEGGMGAWATLEYETEPCDATPNLLVYKNESDVEINWTPVTEQQDYDLLRGLVSNIADAGITVSLGPTDCLAEVSPYTYHFDADTPLSAIVYFYLSRQVEGSWGQSSHEQPRIPQSCD